MIRYTAAQRFRQWRRKVRARWDRFLDEIVWEPSKRWHNWRTDRMTARAVSRGGWRFDGDGWLKRPWREGDPTAEEFGTSCHAFVSTSPIDHRPYLYCRDGRQAAALDRGEIV